MHTYSQLPPASPLASTSNSSSNGGLNVSNNFLDPHFRRKLPAVPGTHGSLSPTSFRRSSTPRSPSIGRTLPTPPGERGTFEFTLCSTPSSPHFSSASPSPPCTGAYLEQRHRKLPPEPMKTPPVQQNSLPPPFSSPAPMNHQLSSPALMPKSASKNNIQNHRILPSPEPLLMPEPLQMPSNNHILAKSAPQSPRTLESQSSEPNALTVNGVVARTRKFSDVRDIARNGSMAHVLEQQHILRQEFTQTPDSALVQSASNYSSLSPSTEQMLGISQSMNKLSGVLESSRILNGPLRVHLMKNKLNCSESRKSSTDGDDPSIHGLDPKIYTTPTGSVSSYSVPDGAVANGTVSTSNSWPENEPRPKGLGLIHCTLQHFPVRKRLRVNILKIEGLAGDLKPELELQPFCKVNLLPGKASKTQMSFVKRGRDAVFNQEFFFDGIPVEELDSKILQIEVFHSSNQKLQKDIEIGEITVPLKDLTQLHSKKEVKIVEELKHKISGKKAGKLNLTTCVTNGVLTVNIIKVEDLPKWGFIGAPDVCVRVTVNQETGKQPNQVKQSRVMKSTCSAVYKESIAFLIQGKMNDLLKTQVIVSVHDMNRSVTGDDVIGSVYFGCKESEKAEADQWKNTIEHQGKEIKGMHHLKPPNSGNPDVHVSETHSDSEE